jgi:hypothetical protein
MARTMNREETSKYVVAKLRRVADMLESGDAWILKHDFKHEYDSGLIEDLHLKIGKKKEDN